MVPLSFFFFFSHETLPSKCGVNVEPKFYSPTGHTSTCMMQAVVFPAELLYASVSPKKGAQITVQLQFKKDRN